MRKVLCIGDRHKQPNDISTLVGYRKAIERTEEDLFTVIKQEGITDIILLGDWYNGGYSSDLMVANIDQEKDKELARLVNGNLYGVIGNHINRKMSSNPELFLIQPHPKYKVQGIDGLQLEPVIKTPNVIEIEGARFYLQHWDWDAKNINNYSPLIKNDGKTNIGIFHTTYIAPNRFCNFSSSSDDQIQRAMGTLNYAISGHIHQPIDPFYIGQTLIWIPGSMTNTTNDIHPYINIPVFVIDGDKVELQMIEKFNLHTDMITVKESSYVELKSLRSRKLEDFVEDPDIATKVMGTIEWLTTKSNYTQFDVDMCKTILRDPDNYQEIMTNYLKLKQYKEGLKL